MSEAQAPAAPLYQQVRTVLRRQIESGQYSVNSTLPTEHDLARSFSVSRATIRSAISGLVSDGFVKAQPGVGTLVIRTRPQTRTATLRGLTEDLGVKGLTTRAVVLKAEFAIPSPLVRARLELFADERVLHLVRMRTIASTPFALVNSYVPESAGISPDEDFTGPLYALIERSHGLPIGHGEDIIAARGARADEADILQIAPGTPVLYLRRTAYLEHDKPVEYVECAMRSDLYEYCVTLPRSQNV